MKFRKLGKILLIGTLSVGVILGVSSCVVSYTVGYLFVTGLVTAQPTGNGIISGFKIGHNRGLLTQINGLPVSSGGANPVRAVLTSGSRFLYVLNRGVNAQGGLNCTTADPCQNSNITQFSVGGNGILTPQKTFFSQGVNPFRIIVDSTGNYLMVLDHDAPDNYAASYNPATNGCTLALGTGVKTCGDITVFQINQTTGRLSLVPNAQVTQASGVPINYFPVPANPVDFVMAASGSNSVVLTLTGGTAGGSFPYTGGTAVWPYAYSPVSGQLTLTQNSVQPLSITGGTAIVEANSVIYVLDNEPITTSFNGSNVSAPSQILPFTVGANGALQAESSGIIPDDPTLANPIELLLEHGGKFLYVANQGNNAVGINSQSGISGYFLTTSPSYQVSFLADNPFGSGAGPQCIVEDPSNQFVYTANYNDSSVTGRFVDVNSGSLDTLRVVSDYPLQGPATWCLMDGRTQ